jgi:hypothetical protein
MNDGLTRTFTFGQLQGKQSLNIASQDYLADYAQTENFILFSAVYTLIDQSFRPQQGS